MGLPQAVKDQDERANQLIEEYAKNREGTPVESIPAPEPTQPNTPVVEPSPEPTPITEEPLSEPSPESVPRTLYEEEKHRREVIQGKLDTEIPVLTQQVSFLMQKLTEQERINEELRQGKVAPAAEGPTPASPIPASHSVKAEEFKKEYPDIYEWTVALIREHLVETERRMSEKVSGMEKETKQEKETKFYNALAEAYPDYPAIHKTPEFQTFMRGPDPLTGILYGVLLNDAFQKSDSARAIRIFNRFYGKSDLPPKADPAPKTTVTTGNPKVDDRIAPSASTGSNVRTTVIPAADKAKAREEYNQLSKKKALGKISEADYAKEEARLRRLMA